MENNNNNDNLRRGNRGRQKVEMVKMKNESNLQVTFSKRRSGLFKKASELCTLCGAEMALVVFSPGRKVFSFGHPSVEEVVERYSNCQRFIPADQMVSAGDVSGVGTGAGNGTLQLIEAHRNANLRELNAQLAQVMGRLDLERKRGEEMSKLRKASQAQCWWENPVDQLDMEQLGQLKKSLEELKKVVQHQADRILMQASVAVNNASSVIAYTPVPPPPPPLQTPQFYPAVGGSGSGQQGGGNMMVVPHNNNNANTNNMTTNMINMNGGFSTNNNSPVPVVNNHGMMNMASLPLAPPPPPRQNRHSHGFNNSIGYGRGGYY
ncbi:Agamous-like MADS-box protein AGL62 [Morus notabilis]|uniref:Agamous-like MADS-box protein AGL62 n=1 Tax=Morus notabilis TaxID=981085 RepID=W9RA29_9ROSA|nr:agamous-like MADS-box protein AGL62 [Morus notabilis]EXB61543.1 Agamous-like MADS-box protein AGL62 [Morus notabilis]